MPLKPGDVVRYTASHHDVSDDELGRVCKRFGTTFFWVHFAELGCVPVKETSLQKVTGSAPDCDGCP